MPVEPFRIHVPDDVLADLKQRLDRTRWPDEVPGTGWDYGANLAYVKQLVHYWRTSFDWRKQERMLNAFPQFKTQVDGLGIHFIHMKGKGPRPMPLIVSHGWPGSIVEFHKVLGPLTDPAAHGGDPAEAFDVVAPSLPGYGLSDRPQERGVNVVRIAELFHRLMTVLGYPRYGAQGGDWGASITTRLGYAYPDSLIGVHTNLPSARRGEASEGEPGEGEKLWTRQQDHYRDEESGYARIQGTKPLTLAYGLNDSPAGLAAWIVEKFRTWSDCNGDVESVYTKDELLTNVMVYWVTGTIGSSARLYYEMFHSPPPVPRGERVRVPAAAAIFPKEIITPPRKAVERVYANLKRWTVMPAGGHFAALERPKDLVEDVRAFFRTLRGDMA